MVGQVRFTKIELKNQKDKLKLLGQYLPSLKLKKLMLQAEVNKILEELRSNDTDFKKEYESILAYGQVLADAPINDLLANVKVIHVVCDYENIAGAEIPIFREVVFGKADGLVFNRPWWIDEASHYIRELIRVSERGKVLKKKKEILEKELREVSIRVNLFEKVLIPRTETLIHQIQIFLSDLDLQAISQAKVAKNKLLKKKKLEEENA
jgi:V/A-type H+-transporting ATPase subunit D